MLRLSLAAAFALLVPSLAAQTLEHPPSVTPEGGQSIQKASEAVRAELLGTIELYRLALYFNGSPADRTALTSPDEPKTLRIAVTFKEDLYRRITVDWRRELVPSLQPPGTAHLRGTFGGLRYGDVVWIEYVPGAGTTVRVNRSTTVGKASHELMLAFLDHWMGQRPVSEEIKRALLGGP
jgi:hypothetical protein